MMILGVFGLAVVNLINIFICGISIIPIKKSGITNKWVFIVNILFVLMSTMLAGNVFCGLGYGFSSYLGTIILTTFNLFYIAEKDVKNGFLISLVECIVLISSGMFCTHLNIQLFDKAIFCIWLSNIVLNSGEMIFQIYRFTNNVKTDSINIKNRLNEETSKQNIDELTKIYNRAGFFKHSKEIVDSNPDTSYTMVCCDIKDFKLVNELFGYQKGDEILQQIADYINKKSSKSVICGRIGTDRFGMLLPTSEYNEEEHKEYIKVITDNVKNSVYKMHIHIGVYRNIDKNLNIATICDRCMLAIKKIKNDYTNSICYYDEAMSEQIITENLYISEFDSALKDHQFKMYLQPQIDGNGNLCGAEALVRWIHPQTGLVPPYKFISVFENINYIHRLDMYIWEEACKKLKEWEARGYGNLYISVNISPKDFFLIDIYQVVINLVNKYGINPNRLRLEITETALMSVINQQAKLLEKLREEGFIIEIDDFGSGYSSLNTLKDIDADILKLDMGFLGKTSRIERSKAVIDTIITLSEKLGLMVISEGVETKEQIKFLSEIGCDCFQGYYFAKPMSVEEFEEKYFDKNGGYNQCHLF